MKAMKLIFGLWMLALAANLLPVSVGYAAKQEPLWGSIAAPLPNGCFDTLNPDVYWGSGTVVNWRTGASLGALDANMRFLCGPGGWIFTENLETGERFRRILGGAALPLAHPVNALAIDGSLRVVSIDGRQLRISDDAGATWQDRAPQFAGQIEQVAVAAADSRAIYVLVVNADATEALKANYAIHFSADAGATWEKRMEGSATGGYTSLPGFKLWTPQAITAPVDLVALTVNPYYPGSSNSIRTYLSNDGARTWVRETGTGLDSNSYYVHSHEGLISLSTFGHGMVYSLQRSLDGGATWEGLPEPSHVPNPYVPGHRVSIHVNPTAPANIVIEDANGLWHSSDGGHSWQQVARPEDYKQFAMMTPAAPLTLLRTENDGSMAAMTVFDAGKPATLGVNSTKAPHGRYFPETRHNLSPLFVTYWNDHGGLAQFGYPKTEPLLEFNPADGKTYLVQYFERNRFEYHPELAGTQYEVLLGLLGNQMTEARRNAGEGPFNRVAGASEPNQLYFPETGHTLRNSFRDYWERHGGLAMYGYPISEEFHEVNPDDGQTYVVQYFERARFEWHPELKGTPYEVLLGLLGNSLLREKGWQ